MPRQPRLDDRGALRQVMGREVVVAITDGKRDFGLWEQIFYGEFDGRRRKRVLVRSSGSEIQWKVQRGESLKIFNSYP